MPRTSCERGRRWECAMLRFEALEKGDECQAVEGSEDEAAVDERVGVESVHYDE